MKILLVFVIMFAFVCSSFGSPLVFKATKEIKSGGELATIDTSKYKNVRVGVMWLTPLELPQQSDILIQAVEDSDSIFIQTFFVHKQFTTRSVSFDAPPSKIKISTNQSGTYKIFVWAQ